MSSIDDIVCLICNSGCDEHVLLLCDNCNRGFHTYCINLKKVPSGSWYCNGCVKKNVKKVENVEKKVEKKVVEIGKEESKKIFKTKKIVHVYIRVSTTGQNNPEYGRVGSETQENAIDLFCQKHNLQINSWTREVGSAYKNKVPKLDKLVASISKNEAIVVYSADRFSRNFTSGSKKLQLLHKKDAFVWSISENMKSTDKMFLNLIKEGENYSKLNSKRIKDANKKTKDAGGFLGKKKPFGFDIVRSNGLRVLKKNPIEQKIIKELKDSYAKDNRAATIACRGDSKVFNKYSNYDWSPQMIYNIFNVDYEKKYVVVESDESDDISDSDVSDVSDVSKVSDDIEYI